MKYKLQIPNLFTAGNLLCGVIGIQQAYEGNLVAASFLIGAGAIFDLLDGMVARLLHATSAIGKDLDSLADMVTFGVLPGAIAFQLFSVGVMADSGLPIIGYATALIPILSAFRLAKFNSDENQQESFIGLPTPAHAIFWASLPIICTGLFDGLFSISEICCEYLQGLTSSTFGIPIIAVLTSLLLVAPIPMLSLKFKNMGWAGNERRYVLIFSSVALFGLFGFSGIPLIILLYLILSTIKVQKKTNEI